MKTPEEINAIKEEFGTLSKKLSELTGEELSLVAGGNRAACPKCGGTRTAYVPTMGIYMCFDCASTF